MRNIVGLWIVLTLAACGNESAPEEAPVEESPIPDSPSPATIADLKAKVGPLVELSATRQGEPGRYDRLGSQRFSDLNALSRWAALWVATSNKCDQLIDMDTRQSSRDELVWVGRCDNGRQYKVYELDVADAKVQLRNRADGDSVRDVVPPTPLDGNVLDPTMMEMLAVCQAQFNRNLPSDGTYMGDGSTGGKRRAGQAEFRATGTLAANAFSSVKTAYVCRVGTDRQIRDFRYNMGSGWQNLPVAASPAE